MTSKTAKDKGQRLKAINGSVLDIDIFVAPAGRLEDLKVWCARNLTHF
jgi:hypothetical protein